MNSGVFRLVQQPIRLMEIMKIKNLNYYFVIAMLLAFAGAGIVFPLSFLSGSNVLIGIILFPLAVFCTDQKRANVLYACFALGFGVLAYTYHVKMFYFFALSFLVLFLLELYIGKLNQLVLFVVIFMSPFFHQVITILGFPIRLQLSAWAGKILAWGGADIHVEGNIMNVNGAGFSVDEACVGLNMLSMGLLMGVAAIIHQYRKTNFRFSFIQLFVFFLLVFILNVFSNLLRIVILVALHIPPEDPLHEITGILCLLMYVITPLYFLSSSMITRFGKINATKNCAPAQAFKYQFIGVLFTIFFLGVGIQMNTQKKRASGVYATAALPGYTSVQINDGIIKLFDDDVLVYVKPIPEFFTGEHTPLFCWKGSGYHFENIKKLKIGKYEVYSGQLVKANHRLFTAWWYGNGTVQTISQFDWRIRMMRGEDKFCLVNVTVNDETILYDKLTSILDTGFIKPIQ